MTFVAFNIKILRQTVKPLNNLYGERGFCHNLVYSHCSEYFIKLLFCNHLLLLLLLLLYGL